MNSPSGDGLADLLARVEKAEGPDRELDCALAEAIGWYGVVYEKWGAWRAFAPGEPRKTWRYVPEFTASLDAALALTERVLPEWAWMVRAHYEQAFAKVWKPFAAPPSNDFDAFAKTPALALLAALLRALLAQPDRPARSCAGKERLVPIRFSPVTAKSRSA